MVELSLLCPEDRIEAVSEALDLLDALSVSVEDADAQTDAEQALFGEPGMPPPKEGWQRSRVLALFANEAAGAGGCRACCRRRTSSPAARCWASPTVPDQDWVRLTQSQFAPVEITPEFWIVPTWHEPPAQARQVIRLDPGLAFGTGTHPTTRMCLRWIAQHPPDGPARAGLRLRLGHPRDRRRASSARRRSTRSTSIRPRCESTRPTRRPTACGSMRACPIRRSGQYQVVLANILATPLKVLAPLLCSLVAPGGSLVLAGILERQADELKAAYAPYTVLEVADTVDGWVLMTASL